MGNGGPLLDHIQARICFTEAEASAIIADLAQALKYLHNKGIAHRDIKPDNILCVNSSAPSPVKLCDFDLCSEASIDISTPTLLTFLLLSRPLLRAAEQAEEEQGEL